MSRGRKTNRDHAKKKQRPMVEDEAIANQLEALITPAITSQENYYRQLGLRDRILNLPLMVAAVLTLLWRDVAGVRELTRILARVGFLWCNPTQVSQQAISQRFLTFPAELFERVFKQLLPELRKAWLLRNRRPLPESIQFTSSNLVAAKTLLLLDRGFYHFHFWLQLIDQGIHFITRLKKGASIKVEQVFTDSYGIRDRLIRMGSGTKRTPFVTLRLIEVRSGKIWPSYLTSVLDPHILPPYVVADLERRRWRIEEAFNTVKRLLGLSYLWTGSLNGVQLQIWATWLFYAVLVDLGDAVADELSLPFNRISLEMIDRGLYHFYVAHQKGLASDPVKYFAASENQDLGIVKQQRKPNVKLIVAPFPDRQRSRSQFFFQPFSETPLTIGIQA